MKIIGITGGIGSGKSQVLSFLKEKHHAVVCQADLVARKLQEPGGKCYQAIVEHFGTDILRKDKTIERNTLGEIVFGNRKKLLELNAIIHPEVKCEIKKLIEKELANDTELFVLEAALLIEEKYDEICDELWYIYTSEPVRRERLKRFRQYSDEKIDMIMESQLSEKVFRKKSCRIIDNSDEFEWTCAQIDDAIKQLGVNKDETM